MLSLIYQILSKSKLRSMSTMYINKTTTTYLNIEIGIQSAVSQILFDFNLLRFIIVLINVNLADTNGYE